MEVSVRQINSSLDWHHDALWVGVVTALLLGAWGCGDASRSPVDLEGPTYLPGTQETEQSIKNGQIANNQTHVVGMAVQRGRGTGICTGTLIAPNLVLTAQHCVSSLSSQRVQCGSTTFTGTLPKSDIGVTTDTRISGGGNFKRVKEIHTPPGGNGICGRDIALMTLARDIPSSEAQPVAPRLNSPVSRGLTYDALGYGRTGANESGRAGVRRINRGRRVLCRGQNCRSASVAQGGFAGNGGTCRGDSGGGAFDNQGRVLGALSRGGGNCSTSLYTSVYEWRSWIRGVAQQAAQSGSYQPPKWFDPPKDADGDGFGDPNDNCPQTPNSQQKDADNDGKGDACDPDDDNDGVPDSNDNCQFVPNKQQLDSDNNGTGDACQEDSDGDGVKDKFDNCPKTPNPKQKISDRDGSGDACDDSDGDGVKDINDNCLNTKNADQDDSDNDGKGDACENKKSDRDDDGVADDEDNCPRVPNKDQKDFDGDGKGDACDSKGVDADGDGIANRNDNCPATKNKGQSDVDQDGFGDACDDSDGDGIVDAKDNCRSTANKSQKDSNNNGVGDACEDDGSNNNDADGDGVPNVLDNCPNTKNKSQNDTDGDGVGDACDQTNGNGNSGAKDRDGDGISDVWDNCPDTKNKSQNDTDGDGTGDACDDGSNNGNNGNTSSPSSDTGVGFNPDTGVRGPGRGEDDGEVRAACSSVGSSTSPGRLAGSLLMAGLLFGAVRLRRRRSDR